MRRALSAAICLMTAYATSANAEALDPILTRIKQNNAISIGYREASIPFSYLDGDRKPTGYSTDLCLKIADAVKQQLSLPDLAIKWVPVNLQNRIPLVANGTVDISCESAVNTIGRQSQVDFSAPFFISHTRLLVTAGSGIKELEDLLGKVIALPINSTPERLVKTLIADKKLNLRIVAVRDNSEGFLALSTGRVDAFATDDILLFGLRKSAPDPTRYEVVGRSLSYDSYGLLIGKNSTVFLTLVNTTMARLIRSGEMQQLYAKWFEPMEVPMSPDLETVFRLENLPD